MFVTEPPPFSISMCSSDENGSFVGATLSALPLAFSGNSPIGIAFDHRTRMLYWTEGSENGSRQIIRAKLDGTNRQVIVGSNGTFAPYRIALDTVHDRIFWCERGSIVAANLDGSETTVVANRLDVPRCDIAVAKYRGYVFWTNQFFIKRAGLDGANRTTVDIFGIYVSIHYLAVNYNESRIYWIYSEQGQPNRIIGSTNVNGNDRHDYALVHSGQRLDPWALYVHGPRDEIYTTDGRFDIFVYDQQTRSTTKAIKRGRFFPGEVDIFINDFPAPAIEAITPTQVITEGVEVTLDCEVSDLSMNAVIAWYHEGVIISQADVLLMRNHGYSLEVVEDGSTNHWVITISNVNSTRDAGNWTCVLVLDITLQEKSTQLFVVKCPDCRAGTNTTQILQSISEIPLTEETVVGVSENIATVVTEGISAADVVLVSDISSRIADLNYTSEEILDSVATIASNLADVDMIELQEAEVQTDAVSHFVQAFQRQLSNVELDNGESINITRPNVAIRIASVAADDLSEGLIITLDLPSSNTQELTRSNINLHTAMDFKMENITAQVDIPRGISSTVSSSSSTPHIDLDTQSNGSDYQQLVFNIYSSPSLYISRSLRNISESSEDFNRSANTLVLSLSIGERKVEMVNELINFTFTPLKPGINPVCSFWDEDLPDWSQDGCQLLSSTELTSHTVPYGDHDVPKMSNTSGYGRVVCGCNHLTSFAVLMDIYHIEHDYEHINRIFSFIGCSISIVALTITVGMVTVGTWRTKSPHEPKKSLIRRQQAKILICLCLSLLALYVTFTVMLALDSTRNHREVSQVPCAILTALIHFSLLSSMAWMGVEGVHIYLHIIKILNSYSILTFMQKATLVAWGIPALIVIATGAISRQYYSHYDRCFLQLWSQIGGLLIPVAIILLFNTVIFVLAIAKLIRSTNVSGQVKDATIARRHAILRVKGALCFFVVLGLTWISGFFLLIEEINEVCNTNGASLGTSSG